MKIHTYWSWNLPEKLPSLAVVADIWTATSTIALLLSKNIKGLSLVNKEMAVEIKKKNPQAIIVGENRSLPPTFFFGSHRAAKVLATPFPQESIYYMSINGTATIEKCLERGSKQVLAASFLNFSATVEYLKKRAFQDLALVASGEVDYEDASDPEDPACTRALKTVLGGKKIDWKKYFARLRVDFPQYYYLESRAGLFADADVIFKLDTHPIVAVCTKVKKGLIAVKPT